MKKIVIKIVGKDVDDDYIQDFIANVIDVRSIKNKLHGKFRSNNFTVKVK